MGKSKSGSQRTAAGREAEIPDWYKPYVERGLERVEDQYGQPHQPYEGQRLAGTDPSQTAALEALGGTGAGSIAEKAQAGLTEGMGLLRQGATGTTDQAEIQSYINPYMQNVTDIAKREAIEESQRQSQRNAAMAAQSGAFGGTRGAVVEGMRMGNLGQQVGDIQAKGLAAAYEDAQKRMAGVRGRQLQAAPTMGKMGIQQQKGLQEGYKGALTAGQQRRDLSQEPLDIAYQGFLEQRAHPRQQIADYLQGIQGLAPRNVVDPYSYQDTSRAWKTYTPFEQGSKAVSNIFGAKGMGWFGAGGKVPSYADGGGVAPNQPYEEQVGQPSGLTSLGSGPTLALFKGGRPSKPSWMTWDLDEERKRYKDINTITTRMIKTAADKGDMAEVHDLMKRQRAMEKQHYTAMSAGRKKYLSGRRYKPQWDWEINFPEKFSSTSPRMKKLMKQAKNLSAKDLDAAVDDIRKKGEKVPEKWKKVGFMSKDISEGYDFDIDPEIESFQPLSKAMEKQIAKGNKLEAARKAEEKRKKIETQKQKNIDFEKKWAEKKKGKSISDETEVAGTELRKEFGPLGGEIEKEKLKKIEDDKNFKTSEGGALWAKYRKDRTRKVAKQEKAAAQEQRRNRAKEQHATDVEQHRIDTRQAQLKGRTDIEKLNIRIAADRRKTRQIEADIRAETSDNWDEAIENHEKRKEWKKKNVSKHLSQTDRLNEYKIIEHDERKALVAERNNLIKDYNERMRAWYASGAPKALAASRWASRLPMGKEQDVATIAALTKPYEDKLTEITPDAPALHQYKSSGELPVFPARPTYAQPSTLPSFKTPHVPKFEKATLTKFDKPDATQLELTTKLGKLINKDHFKTLYVAKPQRALELSNELTRSIINLRRSQAKGVGVKNEIERLKIVSEQFEAARKLSAEQQKHHLTNLTKLLDGLTTAPYAELMMMRMAQIEDKVEREKFMKAFIAQTAAIAKKGYFDLLGQPKNQRIPQLPITIKKE